MFLRLRPYRPFAAKVRPAHYSQQHQQRAKTCDRMDGNLDGWSSQSLKRRPHTVAVMGSRSNKGYGSSPSRPPSTYTLKPACYIKPSSSRKSGKKKSALCGCASRSQPTPSIAIAHLDDGLSEADPTPRPPINSPLNDVTDLLFGIQSVQITVKQPNVD